MEAALYRARRPAETPLCVPIESLLRECVKGAREDLFERRHGFCRGLPAGVVARYLDCGVFERGSARIRCPDGDGRPLEALARDCRRSPVRLARLRFSPGSQTATYRPRDGHDDERAGPCDALDFVARLLSHVPDPRRHLVHGYGA